MACGAEEIQDARGNLNNDVAMRCSPSDGTVIKRTCMDRFGDKLAGAYGERGRERGIELVDCATRKY